tara:strand:+ start:147 stop:1289 length:1143 start_codon:yes stop_codon:yes gene_type:complete
MYQQIKNYLKPKLTSIKNGKLKYIKKDKLKHLIITLTYQCQLKCKMCVQVNTPEEAANSQKNWTQVPYSVIKSRIDELKKPPRTMYLFGGEPLIYKDIFKLSEYLNSKNIVFSYSTNGLLLKKYTKQILDHPPKMISVSMDGFTSELHDEIRGLKGSWQKAIDGMISLFEEKKKRGLDYPEIKIHFTITPDNYDTMEDFYNFFINKFDGVDEIKFHMPRFSTKQMGIDYYEIMLKEFDTNCMSYLGNVSDQDFVEECLTKINTKVLHKQIKNLLNKPKVAYLGPIDLDEIELFFNKPEYYPKERECICSYSLAIQANGDYSACGDFPDLHFGNIKDTSIRDAFYSKKASKWRNYLREKGNPGVLSKCSRLYRTIYSKEKD